MKLPLTQKGQVGIIWSGFTYIIGRFVLIVYCPIANITILP